MCSQGHTSLEDYHDIGEPVSQISYYIFFYQTHDLVSWRRIKHDFLHHFHMPRCDLLVWILVTKLAPTYYRKLDRLLKEQARYRELSSWRKGFKKTWRKLEKTPITLPLNDAYRPNVKKWICTCPAFAISRFLVCKHLIQRMHIVPAVFFLEADRFREPPFWRHKSLEPLEQYGADSTEIGVRPDAGRDDDCDIEEEDEGSDEEDDEDEDNEDNGTHQQDGRTFEEALMGDIDLIMDFAAGLRHQAQFRDQRLLDALEQEGAGFLRFAKACLEKERRMNSTRTPTMSTWEKSTSSAMFYRTRPTPADENT
jgi:hypothetical protein